MKNKDLGFICLFRDFLGWSWYLDINTKVLFVHMLLKANWKEGKFRDITVPRGSFVSSYPHLAEECGLTINELRTALNHLKSTGEITVKASSKYSVFTVNNYCKYQDINIQYDIQSTGGAHSINRPLTIIKPRNKETKEQGFRNIASNISCSEPESAPTPNGILLPLNDKSFYDVPQDKIALWRATYPAVDVEQELRRMVAWLDSNPTKRKTRRGIERFINSWLARTQDSGGSKGQKEVGEAVGNNVYDTDARRERIYRALKEAGTDFDQGCDLPFQ